MKAKSRYSLWLIPSGDAYDRLLNLILQLSKDYGGPPFEPHVTLIGGLFRREEDMLSKTLRLVKLLKPFTVELETVDYLDEFHRCLFTRVRQTDDIINAYSRAQEVFGRSHDVQWAPHLSLLYGDFPSRTKDKIIERMGREFKMSFAVRTVRLTLTEGRPENWVLVRAFSLK